MDTHCIACIVDELYDAAIKLEKDWGSLDEPARNLVINIKHIVEEYRS